MLKAGLRRVERDETKSYFRETLRKLASMTSDLHISLYDCFDDLPFRGKIEKKG